MNKRTAAHTQRHGDSEPYAKRKTSTRSSRRASRNAIQNPIPSFRGNKQELTKFLSSRPLLTSVKLDQRPIQNSPKTLSLIAQYNGNIVIQNPKTQAADRQRLDQTHRSAERPQHQTDFEIDFKNELRKRRIQRDNGGHEIEQENHRRRRSLLSSDEKNLPELLAVPRKSVNYYLSNIEKDIRAGIVKTANAAGADVDGDAADGDLQTAYTNRANKWQKWSPHVQVLKQSEIHKSPSYNIKVQEFDQRS